MLSTIKKLREMIDSHGWSRMYLMLFLILILAFFELLGVASVMPFVMVLSNPEVVQTNTYLQFVYKLFNFETTNQFMIFLGFAMLLTLLITLSYKAMMVYLMERFFLNRNYALCRFILESYLRQPYDFFLNRHSADLGKSILSEAQQVVSGALKPLMHLFSGSVVTLVITFFLFSVDPIFTLLITVGLALSYGSIYFFARRTIQHAGQQRLITNRKRFKTVQECFGGIKEVKITGLEAPYIKRFETAAKAYAKAHTSVIVYKTLPKYALQGLVYTGIFMVILYSLTKQGGVQEAIPTLAVFAIGAQRLLPALGEIYQNIAHMRFANAAIESVYKDIKLISNKNTINVEGLSGDANAAFEVRQSIKLNNLTYRYPQAENLALNSITLTIPACAKVGLVGSSGSGKTTTVDIILGLLQPTGGELIVDGEPISTQNVRAWQKNIGYVPQHIYLIDDTISSNIALGVPPQQINHHAVERAAKIANLHDFIVNEMPHGYATTVGERGIRLSGGQRQRIGIARALYNNPPVLVLDEATSALDNLTEQAIMEAVKNIGSDKTIIIIAHRLSTVRHCDTIFLLDKGTVKAQGSYYQLIHSNDDFRHMVQGIDQDGVLT